MSHLKGLFFAKASRCGQKAQAVFFMVKGVNNLLNKTYFEFASMWLCDALFDCTIDKKKHLNLFVSNAFVLFN